MAYRYFAALALPAAAILAGCVTQSERTGQISIERSFTTGGFRWGDGGIVYIFVKARESQGKVEVCVARMATQGPAYTSRLNDDVLAAASVIVGGDRVLTGIAFATALQETDNVIGKPAACVRTGKPWQPAYEGARIEIDTPRQRFVL